MPRDPEVARNAEEHAYRLMPHGFVENLEPSVLRARVAEALRDREVLALRDVTHQLAGWFWTDWRFDAGASRGEAEAAYDVFREALSIIDARQPTPAYQDPAPKPGARSALEAVAPDVVAVLRTQARGCGECGGDGVVEAAGEVDGGTCPGCEEVRDVLDAWGLEVGGRGGK